jgi:biotin carboxylase
MQVADRRPRILMIGADRYGMEACTRLDFEAVVIRSAASWDAGLIEIPPQLDRVRVEDQTSPEQILAALHRAGLAEGGFDAVYTTIEWALVTTALLARHFGCPTIDPFTAAGFRDKFLQKSLVAAAGIDTARCTVIEDVYDVSDLDELPYERAVLKPVAGAGTALTSVVTSIEDLRRRSREYRDEGIPQRTFVLEEFVPGEEWIVDGVLFGGELLFACVAAYGAPCLATVENDLVLSMRRFDPEQDAAAYEAAVPVAAAALRALGLRDGVFHMELFRDPETGRLSFGECAARRGGALIHEEVQAKFNVHLGECAVLCALGRRPELDVKIRPGVVSGGFLAARAGVMLSHPTPSELRERPGVEFARIEWPYGTVFGEGISTATDRIGMVLVVADTVEEADARLAEVRAWFDRGLVVAPSGARPRELRAWQAATWPDEDLGDTLWAG